MHFAMLAMSCACACLLKAIEHLQAGVVNGIGVVVDPGTAHKRLATDPVKPLDLPGSRLHHVDRPFKQRHGGGRIVHLGDHRFAARGGIDHGEIAISY